MATPLNTQKNGAQGTSVLITLLAWFIGTLPKSGQVLILNALGKDTNKKTDTYDELMRVLYLELKNNTKWIMKKDIGNTETWFHQFPNAFNYLPFVEVTRRHMVRVSGYVTGRSKQVETETRRDKNGAELQDGLRHFCAQCGWLPYMGLNADGVRYCCGSVAELMTRDVAVSDRYEPVIRIPWLVAGTLIDWSVNLTTLGGDPVGAVMRIMDTVRVWNHKDMMTSTPKRHPNHGPDNAQPHKDKNKRIKALLCRIPVLNDMGQTVPMWVNLPAIKGDIFHPVARSYHGLIDSQLKRIVQYNEMLMSRSHLISILSEQTKSLKVSKLVDIPQEVQNHLNRYPKAQKIDLNAVARVEEKRRSRVVETIS
tara:strand:- start:1341 stop:2441 length:1101 start_codon:yes stop_codon:yes gene_type:complete